MTPGEWVGAGLAVIFVGISKAGFGGGTGILATPLMMLVFPPKVALGVMLPLLNASDWVSLWIYRRECVWRPVRLFLPGCAVGIAASSFLLFYFDKIDGLWLKRVLGVICLLFCAIQWQRSRIKDALKAHVPDWKSGTIAGFASGLTSTLAHAAGPVFAMYLIPQRLAPGPFVGTTILAFTFVNLMKIPGYVAAGALEANIWYMALVLSPFVFVGTGLGIWMNRRVSAEKFSKVIYILLFLSGLELATGKSLLRTLLLWATNGG
jgi:uncharacterized membrane protein YfcA